MKPDSNKWSCLSDTANLMNFGNLDITLPTDRQDDTADYKIVLGDNCFKKPFINIGSGNWRHIYWKNIDHAVPPYDNYGAPDINIDLSLKKTLPLEAESIYLAYCSHTLEHLTDDIVMHIFKETYRALKVGGVFRISVPDLYTAYASLVLNDLRYYDHRCQAKGRGDFVSIITSLGHSKNKSISTLFLNRIASALGNIKTFNGSPLEQAIKSMSNIDTPETIAEKFLSTANFSTKRPNQHINYWTELKFAQFLTEAGFRMTLRSCYGQSIIPFMRNKVYFDKTRPNESLWIEAIK